MSTTSSQFTYAQIRALARTLTAPELIRAAEELKQGGQIQSIKTLYAEWIAHNASDPLLYAIEFNHSVVLSDLDELIPARECLEKALSINPDFIPAYINLGRIHERLGNTGLAIVQWSIALSKMAALNGAAIKYKTTALNQSARALEAANQDEAAEAMLQESLELDCHQREVIQHLLALRQRQCKWPIVVPTERVDRDTLLKGMSPLSAAAYADDPLWQLAVAAHYNKEEVGTPTETMLQWPRAVEGTERLRIGYLSSDLREHAVGHLVAEVLGLHNRDSVEVFSYYCGPQANDPLHAQFKAASDHWTVISGMDDATAARKIADDGVQILVDLNGYTREARLQLVALRPAPVIVNWLGYPGTMASPYHHYIIADEWIIPPSHELYYSEKVMRLPCYQPNNRKRISSPRRPTRGEAGLPEDAIVYCCFNGIHKITRFTFDRWLAILGSVNNSVLWLLNSDEATTRRLKAYAEQRGIAPERIVFAEKRTNPEHLARYVLADLILDTTPYGAHTTASDALWMGVPVLTLSGRSFASRVCGSLVRSAGLSELVCLDADEYVDRAVALGNHPEQLRSLRETLIQQRDSCTLFNTPLLVKELEALYGQMWREYKDGALPQPDLSNLDAYLDIGSRTNHDDIEIQTMMAYNCWWSEQLTQRHKIRPLANDARMTVICNSEQAKQVSALPHKAKTPRKHRQGAFAAQSK